MTEKFQKTVLIVNCLRCGIEVEIEDCPYASDLVFCTDCNEYFIDNYDGPTVEDRNDWGSREC